MFEKEWKKVVPINGCVCIWQGNSNENLPKSFIFPSGQILYTKKLQLPRKYTIPSKVFILLLPVRFELPAGVQIAPGVRLGKHTQIAPTTILSRALGT